jgi:maltooligosyltrehalose synthase
VPPDAWGDTAVVLPRSWATRRLTDQLTAEVAEPRGDGRFPLAVLLARCPVALLSDG